MNKKSKVEETYDHALKIIVCGSHGTGKSSLVHVLSKEGEIPKKIAKASVNVEYFICECPQVPNKKFKIMLWDISTEKGLLKSYIQGTQAVVLTFDWSNAESFTQMKDTFKCLTEEWKLPFAFPIVIAHMQSSLVPEVTKEEFSAFNESAIKYAPYAGFYGLSLSDKRFKEIAFGMLNRLISDIMNRWNEHQKLFQPETLGKFLSRPVPVKWKWSFIIPTILCIFIIGLCYFTTLYTDGFWLRVTSFNCFILATFLLIASLKMHYG